MPRSLRRVTALVLALTAGRVVAQPVAPTPRAATAARSAPSPVSDRVRALHQLLDAQWQYTLRTNPEFASVLGDPRYNARLSDYSQAAVDRDLAEQRRFLARLETIDTTGFPEQEQLNHALMAHNLRTSLDAARFREWEMPVTQFAGVHIDLPQLVTSLSFATPKDYTDYIARLRQVPRVFAEVTAQMRRGVADGLMPPRILLVQVAKQAADIGGQRPEDTPFAAPLAQLGKVRASDAEQRRLRDGVVAAVRDSVLPAYVRFAAFVQGEYAPRGRADVGLWALPDGDARYA